MKRYLSLIKFVHTIFAMPFALLGFFMASKLGGYGFSVHLLFLVILCMIFARSAAMAFNRYLDRDIDSLNSRTQIREIPSGVISPKNALIFVFINCISFIVCSYLINWLCFVLSPVALTVILGYSYTKRFTSLCHLVLGLGLSLAPVGAYIAVSAEISMISILLGCIVLFWVAGFDIMYALQDEEFDKKNKLYSIPALLGKRKALFISNLLHFICIILVLVIAWQLSKQYSLIGWLSWVASGLFGLLIIYQHSLVKVSDLRKINLAFFTFNGMASVLYCLLMILDFYF